MQPNQILSYKGDLILSRNLTYVIENVTFQIEGNIIVKDQAKLIIKNSIVKIISSYRTSCKIAVYDEASLEIINSLVSKKSPVPGAIHLLVQGKNAKLKVYNSSIRNIQLQALGGIIYAKDSDIECLFYAMGLSDVLIEDSQVGLWPGYIALKLPDTGEKLENLKFEGLKPGNIRELWLTYREHSLVLKNVNVTAWVIDIENGFKGNIIIKDCDIKEILSHFPYCQLIVKNIRPGVFKLWKLSDYVQGEGIPWNLTLVNTSIEERWKFIFQKNTVAYIENSTLKIDAWEGSNVFIKNSHVRMMEVGDDVYVKLINSILDESLQLLVESNNFTLDFVNSTFGNAFMEMASKRGLIRGSVNIYSPVKVNFAKGVIIREYPLIVRDENNKPAENVTLELINPHGLLTWNGVTNESGWALFNITFTKENYDKEWLLKIKFPHTIISKNLTFLESTPIIISLSKIKNETENKLVNIHRLFLWAENIGKIKNLEKFKNSLIKAQHEYDRGNIFDALKILKRLEGVLGFRIDGDPNDWEGISQSSPPQLP